VNTILETFEAEHLPAKTEAIKSAERLLSECASTQAGQRFCAEAYNQAKIMPRAVPGVEQYLVMPALWNSNE